MGRKRAALSWNRQRVERGPGHGSHQRDIRPHSLTAIGILEGAGIQTAENQIAEGEMRRRIRGGWWVLSLALQDVSTVFP